MTGAKEMTSFRMPADLVKALRERAEEQDCTLSDLLRDGALLLLGCCPTCGRPAAGTEPATGRTDQVDQ